MRQAHMHTENHYHVCAIGESSVFTCAYHTSVHLVVALLVGVVAPVAGQARITEASAVIIIADGEEDTGCWNTGHWMLNPNRLAELDDLITKGWVGLVVLAARCQKQRTDGGD